MNSIGENSSIQYFRSGHYFLDIQYDECTWPLVQSGEGGHTPLQTVHALHQGCQRLVELYKMFSN